jgi:hypothetical protein
LDKSQAFDQMINKFDALLNSLGYYFDGKKSIKSKDSTSLVVYINNKAQKRLEFSGDLSWFHLEIRRLRNNKPFRYDNETNNLGFEYFYKSKDSLDFFVGSNGWVNVLRNTEKIIKKNRNFFTNSEWIISENQDKTFETDSFKINKFRSLLMEIFKNNLTENGFKIGYDSRLRGPNLQEWLFLFELKNDKTILKFEQYDWRDYANIITISSNGKNICEIDILKYKDSDREKLKKKISKLIVNHST